MGVGVDDVGRRVERLNVNFSNFHLVAWARVVFGVRLGPRLELRRRRGVPTSTPDRPPPGGRERGLPFSLQVAAAVEEPKSQQIVDCRFEDHGGSAQLPYEKDDGDDTVDGMVDAEDEEAVAAKAVAEVHAMEEAEAVKEVEKYERAQAEMLASGEPVNRAPLADGQPGGDAAAGEGAQEEDEKPYALTSEETNGIKELFELEIKKQLVPGQLATAMDSEKAFPPPSLLILRLLDPPLQALMEAFLAAKQTWGENPEQWPAESDKAPYDAVLEACADAGFIFNKRSAMGSRFGLYIKSHWSEAKQKEYDEAGNSQKQSMRQAWGAERYENYQKTRTYINSRTETDSTIGTLLNLDALIVAEGGHDRPAAVRGAVNIALSCIKKGYPFVELNEDSGRLEFRHKRKSSRVDTKKKWSLVEHEERAADKKARTDPASALGSVAGPSKPGSSNDVVVVETPTPKGVEPAAETPDAVTKGNAKLDKNKSKGKGKGKVGKVGKDKNKRGKDKKGKGRGKQSKDDMTDKGKRKKIQDTINLYSNTTLQARSFIDHPPILPAPYPWLMPLSSALKLMPWLLQC